MGSLHIDGLAIFFLKNKAQLSRYLSCPGDQCRYVAANLYTMSYFFAQVKRLFRRVALNSTIQLCNLDETRSFLRRYLMGMWLHSALTAKVSRASVPRANFNYNNRVTVLNAEFAD